MTKESRLEKNNNPVAAENRTPSLDTVCTCERCDHDLARDCLKVSCTCCKEYNHSKVLDGIEGFPPTNSGNGSG
ncbi:MAG: hypothetical protein WAZ77_03820 [Candidatus Nitrosopolaris sp.]